MAVKKFKGGNMLDSSQTYDSSYNKTLNNIIKCTNYTSQCTFTNCTLINGGIYKIGRLVIVQLSISPTMESEWATIITIPNALLPVNILSGNQSGTAIGSTGFWAYTSGVIQGALKLNTKPAICGVYLAAN